MEVAHDKVTNLEGIENLLVEAAGGGAELLVLPEACLQGYADFEPPVGSKEEVEQKRYFLSQAETIPGPSTERIERLCAERKIYIQFGLIERDRWGDHLYNSVAMVGPHGVIGTYSKTHNQFEFPYFCAGSRFSVVDLPFGRVGSAICYDLAFPEVPRILALSGAEMIAMSTSWPMKGRDRAFDYHGWAMDTSAASAAFANHVWVLVSNQCTQDAYNGKLDYYGHSQIVAPDGLTRAAVQWDPGLVMSEVDIREEIRASKTERFFGLNMLQDRRPEIYGDLSARG
jgi:predicted amidohydrolase